uniref:Apple domain-containing protein n=1 Tax=Plectus sambesii TaxID=2011161 RepID=A0A914V406_9BILA
MSDSANSYTVGGWCFYYYSDPAWGYNLPTRDGAQSVCLPRGTLAVGVTYKMLNKIATKISAAAPFAWVALSRNLSTPTLKDGWYWRTVLPTGGYATFPAIFSNIPWTPGDPDAYTGPYEDAGVMATNGMRDSRTALSNPPYGTTRLGVICQFAPLKWNYSQRGHGRMANSTYIVTQKIVKFKPECILMCHQSPFCTSLAFNPTNNDCQIYGVSPEDPKFSGAVTADSSYDWYIRDGMEY